MQFFLPPFPPPKRSVFIFRILGGGSKNCFYCPLVSKVCNSKVSKWQLIWSTNLYFYVKKYTLYIYKKYIFHKYIYIYIFAQNKSVSFISAVLHITNIKTHTMYCFAFSVGSKSIGEGKLLVCYFV